MLAGALVASGGRSHGGKLVEAGEEQRWSSSVFEAFVGCFVSVHAMNDVGEGKTAMARNVETSEMV